MIGDRRKYLVALVTLDEAAVAGRDRNELVMEVQKTIDQVNARLARVEQVKRFTILPRQFSIETGELTPTLKIKRKVVNANFASEIEAMYTDELAATA